MHRIVPPPAQMKPAAAVARQKVAPPARPEAAKVAQGRMHAPPVQAKVAGGAAAQAKAAVPAPGGLSRLQGQPLAPARDKRSALARTPHPPSPARGEGIQGRFKDSGLPVPGGLSRLHPSPGSGAPLAPARDGALRRAGVAQRAKVKAKKEEWVELEDMSGKGQAYMPCRLFLDADGYLPCRLNGNFLRIDPDWLPECYVRAQGSVSAVPGKRDFRVDDPNLAALIKLYMGNFPITLYRGVARWNPTWNYVSQHQPMRPIGMDAMPDYTSPNATTSFLPFSPDLAAASVFAKRPQGDRAGESIDLVEGYDPTDPSYEIGRVVKVTVTRQQSVAFCDYAELQVRGPLSYGSGNGQYNDALIFRMGTLRSQLPGQVLAPGMKDVALSAMMPDALPAEEIAKAKKENRLLNRPGVLPAVSAVAVRGPLSALLS